MRFGLREALFILLLLAVPVASYFVVFRDRNQMIVAMREDMARDQQKLTKLEQTHAVMRNLDDEIKKLTEAIDAFEQKLPEQREVESVLKEVWELARSNSLTPKSVRTDKIEKQAQYAQVPIKMQIIGDFDGFYTFLQQLERMPRITRIPEMVLKKDQRSDVDGAMTAEMTLTIFFEGDQDAATTTQSTRSRL